MSRRRTTTEQGYGWAWQQLRLRILMRDGWVCHWCGGRARSVDHVVPKVEGGGDDPANLVAACVPCNSARSMAWLVERRCFFNRRGDALRSCCPGCGAVSTLVGNFWETVHEDDCSWFHGPDPMEAESG